ncbi:MAG TPA: kelch repeat-containing protein [Patescibacteria group bacterium]|nr:kelch repeat-containing protein [Patescibacteria group bacterium]
MSKFFHRGLAFFLATLFFLVSSSIVFAGTGWNTTASTNIARTEQAAILLPSGKVLLTGGVYSGNPSNQAELYDPSASPSSWVYTTAMKDAHKDHTINLITLSDGSPRALVVGGFDINGATTAAEMYNPASGTWAQAKYMNHIRGLHASVTLNDGTVMVFGGSNQFGTALKTVERYDPITNTWADKAQMSTTRVSPIAVLLNDGKVLVAGGNSTKSADIYDPAMDQWDTHVQDMHYTRSHFGGVLLPNGKVFVAGGSGTGPGTAEIFDPSSKTWSLATSSAYMHANDTVTLVTTTGGAQEALVVGSTTTGAFDKSELYDYVNDTWTTYMMGTGRNNHVAVLLNNGNVLVAGGATSTSNWTTSSEYFVAP